MDLLVIGISYKTAPLEIREKLSVCSAQCPQRLAQIIGQSGAREGVLLSTCNRTEVYLYQADANRAEQALCESCGMEVTRLRKHLYLYEGKKCVSYLFRVASGLDSQVMGEDEILRQVKLAHTLALEAKLSGMVMNTLFRAAITTAKRTKSKTGLSSCSISVGTIAVHAAQKQLGSLEGKKALVVGSGEMGVIALKNLTAAGMDARVTVRSRCSATNLAAKCPSAAQVPYERRYDYLDEADVVVSCTSSPHYTITFADARQYIATQKPRVFLDLAVPRDIDGDIVQLAQCAYYNIDQLKGVAEANRKLRSEKSLLAEEEIQRDVDEFERWFAFRQNVPLLQDVRECAQRRVDRRVKVACRQAADPRDEEVIRQAVSGAVDEIMEKFIYRVKETACKEDIEVFFRCLGGMLHDKRRREDAL
ncbi:glutamyl-tRNA reductase [Clostridiaceae bacterium NSJ-31]|uniref:Glutamyl-tRNA reductase n=1 Tax=Ligaoa zhengdingensis TaxID=2763658 RepID=A0A926E0P3_9FIRM|nr:glutamyl-tRNA reductase [Ligaoa zhengdingensis]MBC8546914.1 glutamyl-tRNA reductase [Ligaoa zhengdingensis]